jgi:Mn-dependent DtxR family transcriptional regulator
MTSPIRHLLALRGNLSDLTILDYLTLVHLTPTPGAVDTWELARRWKCSRPQVGRRIRALNASGLVDVSTGWGAYEVHHVRMPEEVL